MHGFKRLVRGLVARGTRAAGVPPYSGLVRRVNAWSKAAGDAVVTARGVSFEVDPHEHIQRYIYYSGAYEPDFTREFLSVVRPGHGVLDIGANVGWFSLLAARRVGPAGRVVAVEPVPSNAARITRNAERNGFSNVHVEVAALAESRGHLDLHAPPDDNEGTYSVTTVDTDPSRRVRVPALRLDEVWVGLGRPAIDVVKIDVQGAEIGVLAGGPEFLRATRAVVFCEIHPRHLREMGRTPRDVTGPLAEAGFAPGRIVEGTFREGGAVVPTEREGMVVFGKA